MIKPVQAAGLGRDKAGQATTSANPGADLSMVGQPGHPEWKPRTDGKTARRISERATVFDEPAPALQPVDPLDQVSDPIWRVQDAEGRLLWTPDLVHSRLLITGEVVRRMPGPLRRGYTSVLGNVALTMVEPSNRVALTPEEITIADWTLWEIAKRAHRAVLLASAFGYSGDKIAEKMQARGIRTSGSTVQRIYLSERRIMAGLWQSNRVPVDVLSWERWETTFGKRHN